MVQEYPSQVFASFIISGLFFVVALLYSMVGHGGASGYLAVMGLLGFAAAVMKPTALLLNLCVSCFASLQFYRAGHLRLEKLWPFVITSFPLAYAGGYWSLKEEAYQQVVGAVLLFAALRFINPWRGCGERVLPPPLWLEVAAGGGIGLLAGLTGTGGGVFLSPLLLHCRWATTKQAAGISAGFIFCNSAAGLAGYAIRGQGGLFAWPSHMAWLVGAVLAGGWIGSLWGSNHLKPEVIRRILGSVLLLAALKLIFLS